MALPTMDSLKTLRRKAGKARATNFECSKTETTRTPLITEAFQFRPSLQQNREKTHAGQTYNTDSTKRSSVQRISDKVDYNTHQPKQTLRRSLRLVEKSKSKKSNEKTYSRFFSKSGCFDTDKFVKTIDNKAASSNGISTYFSQPSSNTKKCFNGSTFFKFEPISNHNKQTNSHTKRKADSSFRLQPMNLSPIPSKSTPDLNTTPPSLVKSTNLNVNSNFEAGLCSQIKIEWATDFDAQFSKGLARAFDEINRILSGDIMADIRDKEDYARTYESMLHEEEESEYVVLDQKIYNNNTYRPVVRQEKKHVVGDGEYAADHNANEAPLAPQAPALTWDGSFPVPRARWVYRTPEKKGHQRPRLDERSTLHYGLIRASNEAGDVSVYRVNRQFQDQYFLGDARNVPLNQRVFSHVGDFQRGQPTNNTQTAKDRAQQVRYLKVKTSTVQDEAHTVDLDRSLDLSSINVEEEYDPFLITRPSKPKSTISRKELFELKRPLDEMEVDDNTTESNFLPKKRLFTAEASFDDGYDECIALN